MPGIGISETFQVRYPSDTMISISRPEHVAVIWQRFLPYHSARLKQLHKTLAAKRHQLTAIEVASQDMTYGFPECNNNEVQKIICFPGQVYQQFSASAIRRKVLETLRQCSPDIVFAPATAFPEGMAALMYRMESGSRVIIMDDAWEMTDRSGSVTRIAKRLIHRLVDGAFIPAPSHMDYYANLNIPKNRIVCGVDVVDNDYYRVGTDSIRRQGDSERSKLGIPKHYFLFVGRFMKRKGIDTLLDAYKKYRTLTAEKGWNLVLVGDGPELETIKERAKDTQGIYFAGRRMEEELLAFYAFTAAFIAPSERDPWALVVNEAMASGLPVIVSKGCGSSQTLVHESKNGWTFEPGDSGTLARQMEQITALAPERLKAMGNESRIIIAEWSLDRFCHGVMEAIKLPRRDNAGLLSSFAVRLWKGRVTVN